MSSDQKFSLKKTTMMLPLCYFQKHSQGGFCKEFGLYKEDFSFWQLWNLTNSSVKYLPQT